MDSKSSELSVLKEEDFCWKHQSMPNLIAVFQYKCDNYYAPDAEGAIAWDDPALGIDWQLPAEALCLSEKDSKHPRLAEAPQLFDYSPTSRL